MHPTPINPEFLRGIAEGFSREGFPTSLNKAAKLWADMAKDLPPDMKAAAEADGYDGGRLEAQTYIFLFHSV